MKKFAGAVAAFLLLSLLPYLHAQLAPEHTYTGDLLRRVKLENSGEKYYVLDRTAGELRFYNADHSPWKTVTLSGAQGMNIRSVDYVTETRIDPDQGLEIAYTCEPVSGVSYVYKTLVVREDGSILLDRNNTYPSYIQVQEEENLPARLIVREETGAFPDSFHVYTLPGMQWQHSYYGKGLKRVYLENSGEKYYLLDQADERIRLYNADHSPWKTVHLPVVPGGSILRVEHVSETKFNQDALLEIGYHCQDTSFRNRITSENGQLLLDTACCMGQRLSLIDGLPARLILLPDGFGSNTRYHVYSVPGLIREYTYTSFAFQFDRIRLEESGEKYILKNHFSSYLSLYNADHSPWKTMMFNVSPGFGQSELHHISETRIDPDNMLEACYIAGNMPETEGWVRKEDGSVLLHLPGARTFALSEIPGLSNKLLATVDTSTGNLHVYSLPSATYVGLEPEAALPDGISVYPNPASSSFVLESDKMLKNVYISSMNGTAARQVNVYTNKTTVDISGLRPGLYVISGSSEDGVPFRKKIVVQ